MNISKIDQFGCKLKHDIFNNLNMFKNVCELYFLVSINPPTDSKPTLHYYYIHKL